MKTLIITGNITWVYEATLDLVKGISNIIPGEYFLKGYEFSKNDKEYLYATKIDIDETILSLDDFFKVFYTIHTPYLNKWDSDDCFYPLCRSAIFIHENDDLYEPLTKKITELNKSKIFDQPIDTKVATMLPNNFKPDPKANINFYKRFKEDSMSKSIIEARIKSLLNKHPQLLKETPKFANNEAIQIEKKILFFTGAGISVESGIPPFRKDNQALWNEHNIDDVCNINTFIKNKDLVFAFYNDMKKKYSHCQPNAFHNFVSKVQDEYPTTQVFTSNIDTLLTKAGAKNVNHVHGNLTKMNCSYCHHTWDLKNPDDDFFNETCPNCKKYKYTKPGVIFFGEHAPQYSSLRDSFYEDKNSYDFNLPNKIHTLKIVAGASLHVITPSHLNIEKGSKYCLSVLVDPNPTNEDDFDIVIKKSANEAIPELEDIIKKFMKD